MRSLTSNPGRAKTNAADRRRKSSVISRRRLLATCTRFAAALALTGLATTLTPYRLGAARKPTFSPKRWNDIEPSFRRTLEDEPGRWAVFVEELTGNRPLVQIGADERMLTASLWKVPAMVEAFRQRAYEGLSFDELLTVNWSVLARAEWYSVLAMDQSVPIRTALALMMSVSDNGAAILLGDRLGYDRIDATLSDLGLRNTQIDLEYPVMSARDMGNLLRIALSGNPAISPFSIRDSLEMRELLFSEQHNERIPLLLPSWTPVAHKTGDLPGVVNDAGVIYTTLGPVVTVFMVNETYDYDRSVATMAGLARDVYDAFVPGGASGRRRPRWADPLISARDVSIRGVGIVP